MQRKDERLCPEELALLPHIMRHMVTETKGAIPLRKLYPPVLVAAAKNGIGLDVVKSGVRRVVQHLRQKRLLLETRGFVTMTPQGWQTAQHYR